MNYVSNVIQRYIFLYYRIFLFTVYGYDYCFLRLILLQLRKICQYFQVPIKYHSEKVCFLSDKNIASSSSVFITTSLFYSNSILRYCHSATTMYNIHNITHVIPQGLGRGVPNRTPTFRQLCTCDHQNNEAVTTIYIYVYTYTCL